MCKNCWPFPSTNPATGKKVVNFTDVHYLREGGSAVITPVNHPDSDRVSNTQPARTSRVIKINQDGSFETLNTIYVPVKQ